MCGKRRSDGLRDRLALDTDILAQASRHGTRVRGTATIHLLFALLPRLVRYHAETRLSGSLSLSHYLCALIMGTI